ncbi:MAG: shikimate dehydrogenase [Bordetella sp.]|nr:shikimate dehydrogenase [Bordetella sp.]
MKEITGYTKVMGILADPIEHVKTPQRMNEHLATLGYDGVLVPFHVRPQNLAAAVQGLRGIENLAGVIVTMPHKSAVLALCDEVTPVAEKIGAANVIRREASGRLVAHMLDGEGFVGGLIEAGLDLKGRHAYLAGAGGAANAIGFSLVQAGVASLTVYNRTASRAEDLKARILSLHPHADVRLGTRDPAGFDVVVNATPLGMKPGDALPVDVARLTPEQWVCEVIMQPAETPLLAEARARGCTVHPGAPMLACQIALMARFLGIDAAR